MSKILGEYSVDKLKNNKTTFKQKILLIHQDWKEFIRYKYRDSSWKSLQIEKLINIKQNKKYYDKFEFIKDFLLNTKEIKDLSKKDIDNFMLLFYNQK